VYTPNLALSFITYAVGSGTLINAAVLQAKGPYSTLNTIFARIRAVNASPGSVAVDQLLGTGLTNANVAYFAASPYTLTANGATTVNFQATATPGAIIASTTGTLGVATDSTAVIAGLPGAQQAFLLQDLNIAPPSAGNRLRFVNASAGSNPVIASINGVPVTTSIAFATAAPYVNTSGTVTLDFTDAVTGAVVASQAGVVLTPNQTSSVYLVGVPGGQGVLVVQDN